MSTPTNANPPTIAPTGPTTTKPPRAELGLRAVFREPAERFEAGVAQGMALVQQAQETLDEEPAWKRGLRYVWLVRLWLIWSNFVAALTFGRVRTWLATPPGPPGGHSLREQIVGERLPALRHEIRAIRRLRRPLDTWALRRELARVLRLRMATWLSWRGLWLRLYLVSLVIRIALAWVWANREVLLFYGTLIAVGVVVILLIGWLQQNWSWIADELNSLLGIRLIPGGR